MKLIPALDLKDNKVVLATGGSRLCYEAVPKSLSPSSDPIKFIDFLLSYKDFNTIYLADLDSITKYNNKTNLIDRILTKYKDINFIIDNGVRNFTQINSFNSENYEQIIATETFYDYNTLLNNNYKKFILSLDYKKNKVISRNDGYKLINPKKVICMSLDNIGQNNGPNKNNLESSKNIYPQSNIVASGGIRNTKDIIDLENEGYYEIILLTAILKKKITYDNL